MNARTAAELIRLLAKNVQDLRDYDGEASTVGFDVERRQLRAELHALGDGALDELIGGARSESALERAAAVEALGHQTLAAAADAIANALRDPDAEVRREAVVAIFRAAPDRAVEATWLQHGDPDEWVRRYLAEGLGGSADPRALDRLANAMLYDAERHVRKAAYAALTKRDPARAELALRPLLSARDDAVRWDALDALVDARSPVAREYLEQRMRDERGWPLASMATHLGKYEDPRSLDALTLALRDPLACGSAARAMLPLVAHFGSAQANALLDAPARAYLRCRLDLVETLRALFRRWTAEGCDVPADRERARQVVAEGLAGRAPLPSGDRGPIEAESNRVLRAWVEAARELADPRLLGALLALLRLPILESGVTLSLVSALKPLGERALERLRMLGNDPETGPRAKNLLRFFAPPPAPVPRPRGSVLFDGGIVAASDSGDAITVVCTDDKTGAQRWSTSFDPLVPEDPRGSYFCTSGAVLFVVDGVLLAVTTTETCRGATPGFTKVHRVLERGRVAWGALVDPAGGDVTITRSPDGRTLVVSPQGAATPSPLCVLDVVSGAVVPGTPAGASPGSALLTAAEAGDAAAVDLLLAAGAALDERDARGETALHKAARRSAGEGQRNDEPWLDVAVLLVARGAERSAKSSDGTTPTALAEQRGSATVAHFLRSAESRRSGGQGTDTDLESYVRRERPASLALTGRDLRGTCASGTLFPSAVFTECNFDGASITYTNLDASFVRCSAIGASFVYTKLEHRELRGCDLRCARFWRGGFYEFDLRETTFAGAALDETHFVACRLADVSFFAARLPLTQLDRTRFERCDFRCADLSGNEHFGTARSSHFEGCDFRNANLGGRLLDGAIFVRCDFTGSYGTPRIAGACEIRESSPVGLPPWAAPLVR